MLPMVLSGIASSHPDLVPTDLNGCNLMTSGSLKLLADLLLARFSCFSHYTVSVLQALACERFADHFEGLTYNQINNNLTSQAATMQLHGLPNDVISNLDPFALIILIPLFDIVIYPFLRKMGINFTPIKRITAGFITGSLAMVWACVIQVYIYRLRDCSSNASGGDCAKAPINVWAQTGAYILIAISEIFASITSLEYAFSKAPKNMRSMVQAVALFMTAISAAIGEAFVSVSADPLLVWNYGSMAVIAMIAGILFHFCFRTLDKEEDALNALPRGHMQHGQIDEVESGLARENSSSFHEKA